MSRSPASFAVKRPSGDDDELLTGGIGVDGEVENPFRRWRPKDRKPDLAGLRGSIGRLRGGRADGDDRNVDSLGGTGPEEALPVGSHELPPRRRLFGRPIEEEDDALSRFPAGWDRGSIDRRLWSGAAENEKTTALIVPEHPVAGLLAGSARAGEGPDENLAVAVDAEERDLQGGAQGSQMSASGGIEPEPFEGPLVGRLKAQPHPPPAVG